MARPLRLEVAGGVYHITCRGNAHQPIFLDDADRRYFLKQVLAGVVKRYGWVCHAYCLMDNHFHLVIETPAPNLSSGMRQVNGVYAQMFNRRHGRVGHLTQGRFSSVLIEKDSHLLEVSRYVVLNPVRAGVVDLPEKWMWSSYRAAIGLVEAPGFLHTDWILSQFGAERRTAVRRYREFVMDGISSCPPPWKEAVGGILLGSERFVSAMSNLLDAKRLERELPVPQRLAGRPSLEEIFGPPGEAASSRWRKDATWRGRVLEAHRVFGYRLKEIADHLGLHYATVSRVARISEEKENV